MGDWGVEGKHVLHFYDFCYSYQWQHLQFNTALHRHRYLTGPHGCAVAASAETTPSPEHIATTLVQAQFSVWVPLFLTRLFPPQQDGAWPATHDLALQCLLKFVAGYGDAFRMVR